MTVSITDICSAADRIAPYIHRTPLMSSSMINELADCDITFKCENLQKTGAFKARGAHNAVLALAEHERDKGVATHSSGNHAAALALAARRFDIPAYIVMPENAPACKVAAVRAYGADITFCESTLAAREAALAGLCERTGACFISPYDHLDVIAGQGTVALELAEQLEQIPDFVICPVGGGGLLAGCAVAARAQWPSVKVIGAEPAGADDAQRSFRTGQRQPQAAPDTIADGLRASLGQLNFSIIRSAVDDILTVDDPGIIAAMRLVWTRSKMLVEPSAAVALGVVLAQPDRFAGSRVAIVLSGGNVDLDALPW